MASLKNTLSSIRRKWRVLQMRKVPLSLLDPLKRIIDLPSLTPLNKAERIDIVTCLKLNKSQSLNLHWRQNLKLILNGEKLTILNLIRWLSLIRILINLLILIIKTLKQSLLFIVIIHIFMIIWAHLPLSILNKLKCE